jgi:hypothetical protein
LINNTPGTNQWISSLDFLVEWDPTYVAAKVGYPDPIQTIICNRHEILLIGNLKSEIWYDAGNPLFPFALLPGAYIEHGTVAPYSVACEDISVFFLELSLQGQALVLRQRGYETKRISTHAIEYAIQQYPVLSDAIGFCVQLGGHIFYILTFPTANATWVYDDSTSLWHQWAWTDADGNLNRARCMSAANLYGKIVVGDWENGTIYQLDPGYYQDDVDVANPSPISFIRAFPHLVGGKNAAGQLVQTDGKRLRLKQFEADIECGNGPVLDENGNPPFVYLRVSADRGKSWGQAVRQSLGAQGQYEQFPKWPNLGAAFRDPVLEISYSANFAAALNGGWIDVEVLQS